MHILITTIAVMGLVLLRGAGWSSQPQAASIGVSDKQLIESHQSVPSTKKAFWLVQVISYDMKDGKSAQLLRFLHQFENIGQCEAVKARSDVGKLECRELAYHTGIPMHDNDLNDNDTHEGNSE
jgi:hypothetical protein